MPGQHIAPADHPAQLLDDYVAKARSRVPGTLAETALRTRSLAVRHILSRCVTAATMNALVAAARRRSGPMPPLGSDPRPLTDLARVVAMQDLLPSDRADGLALLELALERYGPDRIVPMVQGLHAQLAYHLGDTARARTLCGTYPAIPAVVQSALLLDFGNPFRSATGGSDSAWLAAFRRFFPAPGPSVLDCPHRAPFDRVSAAAERMVDGDPMVSVIVTAYRPDGRLVGSVRSLLAQSWRNLEIVIVDDASPPDHDVVFKQCLELDARVRMVKLDTNLGTYTARNAGLDAASGDVVTFQDSDDWSHPLRLEHQLGPLLADPTAIATVSDALRAAEDLTITRPGRPLVLAPMSSLMFRKAQVLCRIGYMDSVRKAADTEYHHRIRVVFGAGAIRHIGGGSYGLTRVAPGSLSHAEISGGWIHPARAAYRSAYALWHQQITDGVATPYLPAAQQRRVFAAPAQLRARAGPPAGGRYDAVFASDWRPFGGPQKSMLEEIRALTRRGMRVGVMQLEAVRFMTRQRKPLCSQVQELINSGTVDHVLVNDDVEVSLLIVRYPPVLQFPPSIPSSVRAERVVIVANQAPSERDGTDRRYVPRTCHEVARQLFRVEPMWCPQGPVIRDILGAQLEPSVIASFDMPGIIDLDRWQVRRDGFRSELPVVGRHSRDNWIKWPADRDTLLQVYPDSTDVDVRVMGGADVPRRLLGTGRFPPNWLVYDYDEVSVRSFLHQIDFYVYFPHPMSVEAFGRAILEALAAGCVTILSPEFARTFGDAALYCSPHEVGDLVGAYRADRGTFLDQSRKATLRVRERFGHDAYASLVRSLITRPTDTAAAVP